MKTYEALIEEIWFLFRRWNGRTRDKTYYPEDF